MRLENHHQGWICYLLTNKTVPISIDSIDQVQMGEINYLIKTKKGIVYGHGMNNWGELGLSHCKRVIPWTCIPIPCSVKQICHKTHTSYFLTEQGQVYGCGSNQYGELVSFIVFFPVDRD